MEGLTLLTTETFNNTDCDFYKANSNIWMTRKQIGQALGYSNPRIAVTKIHAAHKDRLDKHSVSTELVSTDGKTYSTFIYNERGVFEICRWSKQPKANEFIDWVWDIVEAYRRGEFQRQERQTAITPVEKFFDGIENILQGIKEDNRAFKESILMVLQNQQPVQQIESVKEQVEDVKPKEKRLLPQCDNPKLDEWKNESGFKAKYILIHTNNSFTTKGKVFAEVYRKMKNVYGICWTEENKNYKRTWGIEGQRGRVCELDVVYNDNDLKDLFDSILDDMYSEAKRKVEKARKKVVSHEEKDWQYYRVKIREFCEKTGNNSYGGSSVYSVIIRKMDVDWSKYDTEHKKKVQLVRESPELFAQFSKVADKYLEGKLNEC